MPYVIADDLPDEPAGVRNMEIESERKVGKARLTLLRVPA